MSHSQKTFVGAMFFCMTFPGLCVVIIDSIGSNRAKNLIPEQRLNIQILRKGECTLAPFKIGAEFGGKYSIDCIESQSLCRICKVK